MAAPTVAAPTAAPPTTARRVVRRATPAPLTGVKGRPTRACALVANNERPSFCDQPMEPKSPQVTTAATNIVRFKPTCFIASSLTHRRSAFQQTCPRQSCASNPIRRNCKFVAMLLRSTSSGRAGQHGLRMCGAQRGSGSIGRRAICLLPYASYQLNSRCKSRLSAAGKPPRLKTRVHDIEDSHF